MNISEQLTHCKTYLQQLKPSWGGKFLYYCIPFRRKIVLQNIRFVFSGVFNEDEIIKLAQCFYSHIFLSLKENIAMRFMSEQQLQKSAQVVGHENVLAMEQHKKGMLILTGHFGNWEFAPIAGMLNFKQYQGRLHFVRKTLSAKWLEKILFRRYYAAGLHVIPKKNSLAQVCDALDQNDAVVFIMDQHASVGSKDGIMVEFFGKKAGTFRSLAMIARNTEAPVIPAASYRRVDGTHVLEFFKPLEWIATADPKEELMINTRRYNEVLEELVLAHPEQWLWMHRRWKPL